ncbi:hypothetical protein ACFFX1_34930 [Dactylosporangium sucinum]|uniref:Uncharacterized protein n=1 Tax=Dactylosporangium sucinum TaxID=1424081 RepID=A0A917U121_9ACTN|nr:hypothetical protein [Dactylosporangium sucinum]GGM50498.1 hypothetical protein GCM10007977_060300 [Dactylosporangium sucinum]
MQTGVYQALIAEFARTKIKAPSAQPARGDGQLGAWRRPALRAGRRNHAGRNAAHGPRGMLLKASVSSRLSTVPLTLDPGPSGAMP